MGNFELSLNQVRWLIDPGSNNYNLPGYWEKGVNGKRWSYLKINSFSHNVPIINNKGQHPEKSCKNIRYISTKNYGHFIVDLSEAYIWADALKLNVDYEQYQSATRLLYEMNFP